MHMSEVAYRASMHNPIQNITGGLMVITWSTCESLREQVDKYGIATWVMETHGDMAIIIFVCVNEAIGKQK